MYIHIRFRGSQTASRVIVHPPNAWYAAREDMIASSPRFLPKGAAGGMVAVVEKKLKVTGSR